MPNKVRLFLKTGLITVYGSGVKTQLDLAVARSRNPIAKIQWGATNKTLPMYLRVIAYFKALKNLDVVSGDLWVWRELSGLRFPKSIYRQVLRTNKGRPRKVKTVAPVPTPVARPQGQRALNTRGSSRNSWTNVLRAMEAARNTEWSPLDGADATMAPARQVFRWTTNPSFTVQVGFTGQTGQQTEDQQRMVQDERIEEGPHFGRP